MEEILYAKYYKIQETEQLRSFVQTRSQTMSSSTVLAKEHGTHKGMDSNLRPQRQLIKPLSALIQSHVPTESKHSVSCKTKSKLR